MNSIKNIILNNTVIFPMIRIHGKNHTGTVQHSMFRQSDKGRHFQLIFKGINYRAAVWVNGQQIADSTEMAGMFAQYSLDVSKQIKAGAENALAVKIYPLDYPGLPSTEQLKGSGRFLSEMVVPQVISERMLQCFVQ